MLLTATCSISNLSTGSINVCTYTFTNLNKTEFLLLYDYKEFRVRRLLLTTFVNICWIWFKWIPYSNINLRLLKRSLTLCISIQIHLKSINKLVCMKNLVDVLLKWIFFHRLYEHIVQYNLITVISTIFILKTHK